MKPARLVQSTAVALLLLPLAACGSDDKDAAATTAVTTAPPAGASNGDNKQTTESAAATHDGGAVPDACKALTADEVKTIVGATYTTKGGGGGASRMCSYKGADPLDPMVSLTVNKLGAGMTLDSFTKTLASAMKGEAKKVEVQGADDARQLVMEGSSGMEIILAEKAGFIYHLQFADVSKKTPGEKAVKLMEATLA